MVKIVSNELNNQTNSTTAKLLVFFFFFFDKTETAKDRWDCELPSSALQTFPLTFPSFSHLFGYHLLCSPLPPSVFRAHLQGLSPYISLCPSMSPLLPCWGIRRNVLSCGGWL